MISFLMFLSVKSPCVSWVWSESAYTERWRWWLLPLKRRKKQRKKSCQQDVNCLASMLIMRNCLTDDNRPGFPGTPFRNPAHCPWTIPQSPSESLISIARSPAAAFSCGHDWQLPIWNWKVATRFHDLRNFCNTNITLCVCSRNVLVCRTFRK